VREGEGGGGGGGVMLQFDHVAWVCCWRFVVGGDLRWRGMYEMHCNYKHLEALMSLSMSMVVFCDGWISLQKSMFVEKLMVYNS
jgi:hypothetical protein